MDIAAAILIFLALVVTLLVVAVPDRPNDGSLGVDTFKDAIARKNAAESAAKRAERLHWLMVIHVALCWLASGIAAIGLLIAKTSS